ncbi:phage-related protein [Shouchella clausii KSM-K16]|uniref:Phage-related protein n=1 Tax=Shouchella clausii (strain KSM-K16) TaxID=66692 RepID=Q5WIC3_SHOC1|nr:phage-related protein [Shouchella clausii KSM-K16]
MKQFDSRHDIRLVIPPEYRLWEEAEVHFLMEDASRNLLVNDKADYVNKQTGEVVYRLREVDTMKPGCHRAVFRINYGDGTTMSFPQKGYIEVRIERTIHNGRDTHIVEEIALKVSLIDQKFADLAEEVEEWRENVADDVKEKVYENLDIDRLSNTEVIQARGGKKDLNERITGIDEGLNAHIADKKNPHGTTKNDVGLGNVPNWGAATQAEAQAGTNNSKIMTPQRTKEAIDALSSIHLLPKGSIPSDAGIDSYPFGVSVMLVGEGEEARGYPGTWGILTTFKPLGTSVSSSQEFSRITSDQSVYKRTSNGSGWNGFVQQETTSGAQSKVNAHANNKNNPHDVTKSQIGLGNVPNWGAASQADARAGTNNTRMMSPLRTKEAIDAFASEATIIPAKSANVSGVDYPLGLTTFMHSGLGYPTDHGTIFNIKVSNLRFTQLYFPHAIRHEEIGMYFRHFYEGDGWTDFQQVETTSGAQAKVDAHANNKGNPHGVTKAQVGLSNVDNAKQATKVEFDAHVNNKSNPHGVTKSQVGLGSVPNYPVSSQAQAEAGTHTASFMTPQRTKQAFQSFSNEPLNWIRASLQSTWTHSSSWPVRYAKDSTGTVYIEGSMNGGAIGGDPAVVQFILPPGYRPGQTSYFWLVGSSAGTSGAQGLRCYLGANGNFIIQDMTWPGATQFVAVNIVFKAGN